MGTFIVSVENQSKYISPKVETYVINVHREILQTSGGDVNNPGGYVPGGNMDGD